MHRKKHIWCAVMIIMITAFDQLTKYLASSRLKGQPPADFIPGVVRFTYAENTGMAFSMFSGARWVFVALTAAVCSASKKSGSSRSSPSSTSTKGVRAFRIPVFLDILCPNHA